MKKTILLVKTFSLIGSVLLGSFSYSSDSLTKDCYAQFFNPKKSSVILPESLQERQDLLKKIESDPKTYAELLNLPKNPKIRETFFYFVNEALIIPSAQEVYPVLTQQKNNGKTETIMDNIHINFKKPNQSFKPTK